MIVLLLILMVIAIAGLIAYVETLRKALIDTRQFAHNLYFKTHKEERELISENADYNSETEEHFYKGRFYETLSWSCWKLDNNMNDKLENVDSLAWEIRWTKKQEEEKANKAKETKKGK